MTLIRQEKQKLLDRDIEFQVVAATDRSGGAYAPTGLNLETLERTKANTGKVASYPQFGRADLSVSEMLSKVKAEVLVELTESDIRTGQPGVENISRAFERGLDVVTTNKGALAVDYNYLTQLASMNHLALKFRGAAYATIPCIDLNTFRVFRDQIRAVQVIVNATSNYVLTQMSRGLTKEQALERAQSEGIAERDSSLDIGGWDTACKLVILSNFLFDAHVSLDDVVVRSLDEVTSKEALESQANGYVIKPMGELLLENARVHLTASPKRIPLDSLMASVAGFEKAIAFDTAEGELFFKTEWAGATPSACAILRDLIDVRNERVLALGR